MATLCECFSFGKWQGYIFHGLYGEMIGWQDFSDLGPKPKIENFGPQEAAGEIYSNEPNKNPVRLALLLTVSL